MPDVDKPNKRLVLLYSLLHVAEIYADLKNYDECIWYAQEFIKEDYTYREPYLLLADIYNDMKMYTLAEAMVKCALEYGKQHFNWVEEAKTFYERPYDALSVAQFKLNKLEEAKDNMAKAIKHSPDNLRLLKNYIACLENLLNTTKK